MDRYEINVARLDPTRATNWSPGYVHHFKADVRDEREAMQVYHDLKKAFPWPEYEIRVTFWREQGMNVNERFDDHHDLLQLKEHCESHCEDHASDGCVGKAVKDNCIVCVDNAEYERRVQWDRSHCEFHNGNANALECHTCNASKPAKLNKPIATSLFEDRYESVKASDDADIDHSQGDWKCKCGHWNMLDDSGKLVCKSCGKVPQ